MLHRGVIYCTGPRKAAAAEAYLRSLPQLPRRVVFVDDTVKHLEMVKAGLAQSLPDIEYVAFHYTGVQVPEEYSLDAMSLLLAQSLGHGTARESLQKALAVAKGDVPIAMPNLK